MVESEWDEEGVDFWRVVTLGPGTHGQWQAIAPDIEVMACWADDVGTLRVRRRRSALAQPDESPDQPAVA